MKLHEMFEIQKVFMMLYLIKYPIFHLIMLLFYSWPLLKPVLILTAEQRGSRVNRNFKLF